MEKREIPGSNSGKTTKEKEEPQNEKKNRKKIQKLPTREKGHKRLCALTEGTGFNKEIKRTLTGKSKEQQEKNLPVGTSKGEEGDGAHPRGKEK